MIAEPETLLDLLQAAAHRRGDQPLYRFLTTGDPLGPQETLSASGLLAEVSRIAAALRAALPLSSDEPERIVIACWSPLDFARAFFGCLAAGATPVPAYPPPLRAIASALDPLKSIMVDCNASALIGEERSIGAIVRVEPEFEKNNACRLFKVDDLLKHEGTIPFARSSATDTAFLQYTSGSTTEPRGVIISNKNILSNLKSIVTSLDPPKDGVGVSWLPWSHDLGLIGNFLMSLHADIKEFVVMTPLAFIERPARWLQAISQFRAWGTSAPNFAFGLCNKMIRKGQVEGLDLSCLQSVLCGAEPIDAATLNRFAHRFAPQGFRRDSLRPCYGLAEATLFVSLAGQRKFAVKPFDPDKLSQGVLSEVDHEAPNRNIVSCGKVQPALELTIVDPETTRPVDDGQVGEVWISGPGVANGYFGWTDERNAEVFRAALGDRKCLRTGDLGALSDGGFSSPEDARTSSSCTARITTRTISSELQHQRIRICGAGTSSCSQTSRKANAWWSSPKLRRIAASRTTKIARQIRAKLGERLGLRPISGRAGAAKERRADVERKTAP